MFHSYVESPKGKSLGVVRSEWMTQCYKPSWSIPNLAWFLGIPSNGMMS